MDYYIHRRDGGADCFCFIQRRCRYAPVVLDLGIIILCFRVSNTLWPRTVDGTLVPYLSSELNICKETFGAQRPLCAL